MAPSDPTPFCPCVSVPQGAYPSLFPSLRGGAPWPREKARGLCEPAGRVRGAGLRVRPGLGPFDAWAGVGARARIKRPQSCPQPGPPAILAPPRRRGGRSPFERPQRPLYASLDTPFLQGTLPASSSPVSLEKKFWPRLAPVAQLHFPYSLLQSDLRWGEGDRAASTRERLPSTQHPWLSPQEPPSGVGLVSPWGVWAWGQHLGPARPFHPPPRAGVSELLFR